MVSFLVYLSISVCGIMVLGGIALAIMCFIHRNTEIPHTPQEDEEQMKYLEEYYNKKK
jgi:hypothetical protein